MPLVSGRGLTQTADNCFLHTQIKAGAIYTTAMVGIIHRQTSAGRDNPPACANGFDCDGTPFAKGHIMALELGGPDISDNIVPQYGQWQGNARGAWRQMEVAVAKADPAAHQVMIVALDYANVAETYLDQKERFRNGAKLHDWTDPRIPVGFRVWVTDRAWTSNGVRMAEYLADAAAGKEARIGPLVQELNLRRPLFFNAAINAMPDVDRGYWRAQMVLALAWAEYANYEKETREAQQKAAAALAPSGGGGPMRRIPRGKIARLGSSPMDSVIPQDPLNWNKWLEDVTVQQRLADAIRTNKDRCAIGWTDVEKTVFMPQSVASAVFAK